MTREHKLALIIGFSLVLLIGVLISDHFSRAGSLEMAGVTERDVSPASAVLPVSRDALGPVLERGHPAAAHDSPGHAPGTGSAGPAIADSGSGRGEPVPGGGEGAGVESDWPGASRFINGANPPRPAAGLQFDLNRLREKVQESGWLDRPGTGTADPGRTLTSAPGSESAPAGAPKPVAAGPAFADYTVKSGESLFQIAARQLGDGNRWREIRDANPKAVSADGGVRAGVRLRIPLAGAAKTAPIQDPLKAPAKAPPRAEPRPAPSPVAPPTYTVRKGESLGEIAQRTLGSSRRAGEIAALNGLKDANLVRAGMVLKIPQG